MGEIRLHLRRNSIISPKLNRIALETSRCEDEKSIVLLSLVIGFSFLQFHQITAKPSYIPYAILTHAIRHSEIK